MSGATGGVGARAGLIATWSCMKGAVDVDGCERSTRTGAADVDWTFTCGDTFAVALDCVGF